MDTILSSMTQSGWVFSRPLLRPARKGRSVIRMTLPTHSGEPRRLHTLAHVLGMDGTLSADPVVTGVRADSRQIEPGNIFVAIRGYSTDGHLFVKAALERGACAVVLEDPTFVPEGTPAVPVLRVASSRRGAAMLADEFYDHPSQHLQIAGVTGTNGKTTVSLMLESIFRLAGQRTGVIGTLGRQIGGAWRGAERTTPDAIELQELLADMVAARVSHVAMEVSSHALELDRVYRCRFAGAVFTNLSQDHLDFHSGLDEYLEAKLQLFTSYADAAGGPAAMVGAINVDDPAGAQVAQQARCRVITYGTNGGSQVRARGIDLCPEGVGFQLVVDNRSLPVKLHLTGHFNVHNALGAAACCWGLGFPLETIVAGLEALPAVPGRFERVAAGQPYTVIVDYAHSPGALQNTLTAAKALSPGRLICVMGCGGDRDRGKRPMMGKVATELADVTIVTSDNPRSEDPLAIIDDIRGGIGEGCYEVEPDRRTAIFRAIEMCRPGDMALIAGKGHETYQQFADHRIDFDDRLVAREAIHARGV